MTELSLYPLRFAPIFQPRIWGGRRLADLFGWPLPGTEAIGEAWVLSDRDDYPSRVVDGPLRGQTLPQLLQQAPVQLLGRLAERHRRFPLLLKFLDAQETLSVQVHPTDEQKELLPPGERGKTEAWLVLQADPSSRIYAGLPPGTTPENLRRRLEQRTLADTLPWFAPKPGDGVFLPAGTVHALGGGLVVFECQQNSDVTFRLYDWDRVDAKTGQPRPLHIDQALACSNYALGPVRAVTPLVETTTPVLRERFFSCDYFRLWRLSGTQPFLLGSNQACRVLVGLEGQAQLEYSGGGCLLGRGDVLLVPAAIGVCRCRPTTALTLLEIALPE